VFESLEHWGSFKRKNKRENVGMVGRGVTRPKGNRALNYFLLFSLFFLLEISLNTLMIVEIRFHPKMGKSQFM
jgi:hypothetical protein